ncbi:cell division transport system permease protein [Anaerosolibacter carboniphilus]|uniref:Cell division protein FtsX n=1 Tax=Anaerosolibacter carboniphilus TaxID=1417629 RepID=A0A841KXX0_9FIRM|nr:permease-like cell division protein FtsX [Anaerosolibacter carboniphilus]MBB6215772.1 cell division transport system permease protein [Anaerosolibacter carboniphilus]
MRIRTVSYMIHQGFKSIWRNRMMSVASVGSVASALVILGIVFMLVLNINSLAESAKEQFDSVQVYLKDEVDGVGIEKIGAAIIALEGIEDIDFLSKEEALNNMKEQWGDQGYLLEGLETNPLPNSFVIKMKDVSYADAVVKALKKQDGIEEVKYYKDIVDNLLRITHFIRLVGIGLIAILIGISMFIIANTIKLAVAARYREINIMKYVGATNWFIRWPFLIEGVVLGCIGALIALSVVGYGYKIAFDMVTQKLYVMLSAYMIPSTIAVQNLAVIFVVLGAGIGALGSIFSMRKFLRV